jgi:hypothetical protein
MRFPKTSILIVLFVSLVLVGCGATFNQKAYRGMGVMATSYDISMKSAADLHTRGLISEEGKQDIIEAARPYSQAHNKAIDNFVLYLNSESPDEQERLKQQYITSAKVALEFYSTLLQYLNKYQVVGGEPVEPWF